MYKAKFSRASIRLTSLPIKSLAAAMLVMAVAGQAHAAVNGGTVAAGAATIGTNGATTTINQSTDRAIINWKSFDIGAGETVQIIQPTSKSAILNRVNSTTGTRIDGALNANGQVYVVNPNGVVVGKSGRITAGGGVALSTLDVSNAQFMQPAAGNSALNFHVVGSLQARVVNDGTIVSTGGTIALVDSRAINNAAGTVSVSLDPPQYPGLTFIGSGSLPSQQSQPAPAKPEPSNPSSGLIPLNPPNPAQPVDPSNPPAGLIPLNPPKPVQPVDPSNPPAGLIPLNPAPSTPPQFSGLIPMGSR